MKKQILNDELLKKMREVNFLYGVNKGEAYKVDYEEGKIVSHNGNDFYPLYKTYTLSNDDKLVYYRIESNDNFDILHYGKDINYDINESLSDDLGVIRVSTGICSYLYNDDKRFWCYDNSVLNSNYEAMKDNEACYCYSLDRKRFKAYNDTVWYDIENDKLYFTYGGTTYELDPHKNIANQIHENSMNMPAFLILDLQDNDTVFTTICLIMDAYKLHCRYINDKPRIKETIDKFNNLSTEEIKDNSISKNRNLSRKPINNN